MRTSPTSLPVFTRTADIPTASLLTATGVETSTFPVLDRRTKLTATRREPTLLLRSLLPSPPRRSCTRAFTTHLSASPSLLPQSPIDKRSGTSFCISGQTFNTSVSSSIALADANYSSTLLSHAQDLYQFANSSKRQTYQTAVPAAGDAYASSNFGDDLTWAALWVRPLCPSPPVDERSR